MNYTLSDNKQKTYLYCSIITEITEKDINKKTCICSFSWDNEDESEKRLQSNAVIIMANRKVDESELNILQSAWVTAGKEYYKTMFGLPKDIEDLDIQFNCVSIN